jgi:hypothetical protein
MKKETVTKHLGLKFEVDDLIYGLEWLEHDDFLLDKIMKSLSKLKDEVFNKIGAEAYFNIDDEKFDEEEKVLKEIYKKINPQIEKKIHSQLFDGSLLPALSKNYKLIIYFEMKIYSHYLIHDKKGRRYYYVTNKRAWDKKKNKPISKLLESFISAVFEKKPSKSEFFKAILIGNENREDEFMEKNKAIEYEKREKLWEKSAYVSSKGLDYLKLYKQVYNRHVNDQ